MTSRNRHLQPTAPLQKALNPTAARGDHADPALRVERCSVQLPPSADEGMCIVMMGGAFARRHRPALLLADTCDTRCERLFRDQAVAPEQAHGRRGGLRRGQWKYFPRSPGVPDRNYRPQAASRRRCWSS